MHVSERMVYMRMRIKYYYSDNCLVPIQDQFGLEHRTAKV